jgi:hypothetical protein
MKGPLRLSKEEVAKLSSELQDAVARIALDEGRKHRRALENSRGFFADGWVSFLLFMAVVLMWKPLQEKPGLLPWFLASGALALQYHAFRLNSRIDALLELMEKQQSAPSESESLPS